MQTLNDAANPPRKGGHPLTIGGQNILELSRSNPAEAHKLVARALGEKGHRSFFEHRGRQACIQKAMAKPLPGALGNAFLKSDIKVGSRMIRPVVPAHFAVLQALDSPLLKLIAEATSSKSAELKNPSQEEKWEICHVFTAEPKTLFKELKSKGVDFIREQAQDAVGMTWEAAEVELAMPAIMEQLKRHIETTVRFAAEMEAKNEVSFFREQKPEALKPTA